MYNPTREQARLFFFEVQQKNQQGQPLTPLEDMALQIINHHPEYHYLFNDVEKHLHQDWHSATGESNPFLHLSLHLAIEEQLSINQPPGIQQCFLRLCGKLKDEHAARHVLLEVLTEMIWQAQQNQRPLNNQDYLTLVESRIQHS